MKLKNVLKFLTFAFALFLSSTLAAQTIKGKVTDSSGEGLPYMNIVEKGNTSNGIVSSDNGEFSITVGSLPTSLVVSSMGFETKTVNVTDASYLTIVVNEDNALDEVVVTGSRNKPRTILDSPVPIDNIDVAELVQSGKPTLDRMLTFKVPSFNSQNQAISDATAHYDPADLRGLGPSRTLVLINGKRKNQSAQVYLNRTPGKGEVGVDLKSIPTAAIERVEVLRDGASAIYGSDAIAGVMNIILKKDVEYSTFSTKAGITSEQDGFSLSSDFNTAFGFGDGGFVNVTLGYYKQETTNRAGIASDVGSTPRDIAWLAANPRAGMTVGQPAMEKKDLFVNMEHPIGDNSTLYSFHGYTTRDGQSFAYYRAPYWRNDVADANFITKNPNDFIGYQPTFETKINDYINAIGVKFPIAEGWNADASVTYGSNDVDVTVNNSVNRDYLADNGTSPRTFNPGGYAFTNIVGNFDVNSQLSDALGLALGMEFKQESFKAIEGNPLSYYGAGSDSFAGIKPDEAGKWSRNNLALYTQLDYDVNEKLLLGVAGRYEDFTDAGSNFSWKANGRYKLGSKGALRASYSTGFRAPTLHQSHITLSQYIIVAGSSEPLLQGTLANDNPAVQALGVPSLTHEISKNLSAGLTYKFDRNFSASVDFYQIQVDDRVLFSSQIGSDGDDTTTNPVEQILQANNVVAVQVFINAGDTKTTGADIVLNYRNIEMGEGKLHASFAANFNKTTIDAINTPQTIADAGYDIFDRQEQGLITNSRPRSKMVLGLNYIGDAWDVSLNNTRFGEVTVTAPASGTDQELSAKITTDLGLGYKLTDRITFNANINNIFDVYPDVTKASTGTSQAGSRFMYSSEVQQLGQLGTNYMVGINYQF
ncbi:MAG: TonB-dependent receptor [Polaribacter sp.]|mgnify:FL=1|jgi:iron complex outermembrane receptor protein|nr:TonB-dependent receptor [Polaribacter sp.]MBT6082677.1 TonB-dependent receptor [Polaribacter sp.]MBT7135295.1 TonB-dependent receptor [Polaribacter sp.]